MVEHAPRAATPRAAAPAGTGEVRALRPADQRPTEPIWQAHTLVRTTDHLRLPPAVLLQDARLGAALAERAAAAVEGEVLTVEEAVIEPPVGLDGHEFVGLLERSPLGRACRGAARAGGARLPYCLSRAGAAAAAAGPRALRSLNHPALPPWESGAGRRNRSSSWRSRPGAPWPTGSGAAARVARRGSRVRSCWAACAWRPRRWTSCSGCTACSTWGCTPGACG